MVISHSGALFTLPLTAWTKKILTCAYKIQINKVARKSKAASRQNSRRDGEKVRNVLEESKTGSLMLEVGWWVNDSASDPWLTNELIIIILDQKEPLIRSYTHHETNRDILGNRKTSKGTPEKVEKDWWWISTRWPSKMRSHLFWRSVLNEKWRPNLKTLKGTWNIFYLGRLLHMVLNYGGD